MAQEREIDIAKNIRTIEWLKTELLSGVSGLFKALLRGTEESAADALSGLVITAYTLARRLGIPFSRLEARIENRLRMNVEQGHEIERWYGDLSALAKHFEERR
ncbi:MAG: MazG-like family protein [Bacillota bacterium]